MADRPTDPRSQPSLDEIVGQNAVVIAEQIQNAAGWAKSEMDLQVEVAGALKEFARMAKINPLEGHHNVTIATGRPDSVYGSVIVEYKDPGTLSPNKDAAPNKAVIEQLKRRFYDMNREDHRNWSSMFGVGTDGKYFIFLRFRDDKWTDQEPLPVNRYSTERFLWALYNLGQKGKPYQPEYLHGDFGSDSPVAQEGVRALYEEILSTDNPKAQVFFNQWKILFGEVCGYDVENLSDKLKKLAEFYVVKGKPQPAPLLFAVHTYYAILIKLLASDVVSFFYSKFLPRQVERLINAATPAKLKRELEDLESGGIFQTMQITNFLEGDLFAWYLAVWTEPIEKLVRKMITKLDEYNPGTFSEEPAQSRDLLKKLYQQLFPKSVRHDLGEYFTPDWLAEHVLNQLGYEGDPEKRLLDPACGSGTFLVMAINRIRRWYDQNREKCAYDEGELLKKILANVIGFDLNPLAVMAARTNYLVAIKDLIRHVDGLEIPIYLCDSILTPSQIGSYQSQMSFLTEAGVHFDPSKPPVAVRTAAGTFLVQLDIAKSREHVARYAEVLEFCVRNKYKPEEFLLRCREEGLPADESHLHLDFYEKLLKLDGESKNGIWARIVKNNFAPLFVGRVDYVAGNPPWIRWGYLPDEYRTSTASLWQEYGLFSLKGFEARLGSGEKDFSQLFAYVSVDRYLKTGGKLGFLITQTVFKAKGQAEGFRRFRIGENGPFFRILRVDDLSRIRAFEAANLTAAFIALKGEPTSYPVPYFVWEARESVPFYELTSLAEVLPKVEVIRQQARPSGEHANSQWQTSVASAGNALKKLAGPCEYSATRGAGTDPYGVFHIRILRELGTRYVLAQNIHDAGKKAIRQLPPFKIEKDVLFPLVRGRDIERWFVHPEVYVLMVQDPESRLAIPIARMRQDLPLTLGYLQEFKPELQKSASKFVRSLKERSEFYAMYGVSEKTFAEWRVAWRRMGNIFRAAVISHVRDKFLGSKLIVPSDTVSFVACNSRQEASYLCCLLNSAPCRAAVYSFSAGGRGLGAPAILKNLRILRYSPKNNLHAKISEQGERLVTLAKDTSISVSEFISAELELDEFAAEYWSLTPREMASLIDGLRKIEVSRASRAARGKIEDLSSGELAAMIAGFL